MHVHQPGDQVAVRLVEPVLATESARIDRAEFRVIAAAALGDVVKQGGQVQQLGLVERGDQAAGERELVRQLRHGEAPHVAQHGEDVLVDRVDVEEVVLHLPDDAAERRDVAPEQAVAMHRAQRPGDAQRLAQQRHEQGAMQRIGAKRRIDAGAAAPQRAQRRRLESGERRVLGIHDEGAQQGVRLAFEQIGGACFEQIGAHLEIGVDRLRRRRHREQPHAQRLDEDVVDALDQLGGAVIALHQALAGAAVGRGGQPEAGGQFGLVIEGEAVFAPPGQEMQMNAQRRQRAFLARDAARLGVGEQAGARDAAPAAQDAAGLRQPVDGVQVAQAARAVLQVGLELVGAVVEARVARLLLGQLAVEEMLGVEACLEAAAEFVEQARGAAHVARLQQIGFHRDVGGLGQAGVDRAHAVADLQPDVPAGLHPGLQRGLLVGRGIVRQQQQHVHVGTGKQFAAPVAADGGEAETGGQGEPGREFGQHAVDQRGVAGQVVGGGFFEKGRGQFGAARFEPLAKVGERLGTHAAWRMRSGTAGVPADTVSTS